MHDHVTCISSARRSLLPPSPPTSHMRHGRCCVTQLGDDPSLDGRDERSTTGTDGRYHRLSSLQGAACVRSAVRRCSHATCGCHIPCRRHMRVAYAGATCGSHLREPYVRVRRLMGRLCPLGMKHTSPPPLSTCGHAMPVSGGIDDPSSILTRSPRTLRNAFST